ncbi:MAG: rhodanese-like domain-containing protein [Pseudomonadales bacterium]
MNQSDRLLPRVIEPETLKPLLGDRRILVIDLSRRELYDQVHVPGAIHVATRELVAGTKPATGKLPPHEQLNRLFSRIGFDASQHFVVYDDEGGGWAGRFIWTLDVIGHEAWSYLNGGIHAWSAAAMPMESHPVAAQEAEHSVSVHARPIANAEDILERLGDPGLVLWDSRSKEEFRGERVSASRGGHIPGAVHLDWLDLTDAARHYRLRSDLEQLLADHGITPDKNLIVYCQTHHRSGLAYLVARYLNYPNVRGYHGSWSEWGNRDDTPVEQGE